LAWGNGRVQNALKKKQDRRNLGVPAILTNHNKQTYANYAFSFGMVAILSKKFFTFGQYLL